MTDVGAGETACASCGRVTGDRRRWVPVLRNGEVTGHTCPSCPRAGTGGEPIRRVEARSGPRFQVTLDIGADATGRRRQEKKTFSSLAAARAHVRTRGAEIKTMRLAGRSVSGRDLTTISQLCDRWLEARRGEVRELTRETYSHELKPIRRKIGQTRVQALTYEDVRALRSWLLREGSRDGGPLGEHAVKSSLARLKAVLDYAVQNEGIISVNVAKAVRPPRVGGGDAETILERWTAQELLTFLTHADQDRLGAAWRLAALGFRREEVLGLTWDDVDFAAGTITVRQTRVAVSRSTDPRRWMLGPPKSVASKRRIKPDTIQPGTMAALRRLRMVSMDDPELNGSGLIVTGETGTPVMPAWFSDRFAALARAADVPVIRLHSTRHTIAYLMHEAGIPPVRAAAFLGHTLAVHLGVYLFAREDDVDLAGAALGAALMKVAAGR